MIQDFSVQSYKKAQNLGATFAHINAIAKENSLNKDMLLPNVVDNYHTVGLKMISAFKWITELKNNGNLKWIIKMDDDILIKFATLDSYLSSKNVSFQAIHCPIHNIDKNKPRAPIRDPTKKW